MVSDGKTRGNALSYDLFALGAVLLKAKTGMDEMYYAHQFGADFALKEFSSLTMQAAANMLGSDKYTDMMSNKEKDGADMLGDAENKIKGLLSSNLGERAQTFEKYKE